MEERGRLCAKCTDLASFPECLTDPAASSQLRPRPPGLRAIGAPVLHDYTWTLSRKECLGTALPGPLLSPTLPSYFTSLQSAAPPCPSLLAIEQNERSAPVMIARDYLSLPSPPKQLQRINISDAPWSFLSLCPENQPRNAIIHAETTSVADVNSNREVQMFPPCSRSAFGVERVSRAGVCPLHFIAYHKYFKPD